MADTKELIIELSLENNKLKKELLKTEKGFSKLSKTQEKTKFSLKSLKAGYIAIAGILTGVVASAFKNVVKKAIAFEEANSKFSVVFKGVSKEANSMRKELVNAYGVSTLEATNMLSGIQDFLVPMGIARDEAVNLSGAFSKLAADIGSFNDVPTAQVLEDIKSGLAGQSEPLRKYGIDILDTTLKEEAMAKGIALTNGRLDRQSRAMLIFEKIVKDSKDAMGDFNRTQDSFANKLKRIGAIADDVQLVIGQELKNALVELFGNVEIDSFRDSLDEIREGFRQFVIAAKIGFSSFMLVIRPVIDSVKVLWEAVTGLGSTFKNLFTKGFKAAGEEIKKTFEDIDKIGKSSLEANANDVKKIIESTKRLFSNIELEAIDGLDNIVDNNEKAMNKIVEKQQETAEILKEINKLYNESITLSEEEQLQQKIDRLNKIKDSYSLQAEEMKNIEAALTEYKKQQEKIRADAEKDRIQAAYDQTKSALGDIAGLTSSSNKTLFAIGKASATANAIINTIEGITKTMAKVPFPFNIPLAAGQAAAGYAQVAKIQSQQLPAFAEGGRPEVGRPALVGERGPEIFVPDRPGTIIPNNQITNNNMPNVNINVTTNRPKEIVETLNDYFRQFGGARSLGVG